MSRPPVDVVAAFGARGEPVVLAGGQGTTWRAGSVVLKPVDDVPAACWTADVLSNLVCQELRLQRPVADRSGSWVVGGWCAFEYLDGAHDRAQRWPAVLEVATRLNLALADVARPSFLPSRQDIWAVGDRVAWGEEPLRWDNPILEPLVTALVEMLVPHAAPSQLVHGDLAGNVLFARDQLPAVIDLSPYWRPASWCHAVVAVDAVLWHKAHPRVLASVPDRSLLPRAALYRLVTSDRAASGLSGADREAYLNETVRTHDILLAALLR